MLPAEKAVLSTARVKRVSRQKEPRLADTAAMCHFQGPERVRYAAVKTFRDGCFLHVCAGREGQSYQGLELKVPVCSSRRDSLLFFLVLPPTIGRA